MDFYTPRPSWQRLRGRVAGLSRDRAPDDPEYTQARHDLAVALLEERIRTGLDKVESLSLDDVLRLTGLVWNAYTADPDEDPTVEASVPGLAEQAQRVASLLLGGGSR